MRRSRLIGVAGCTLLGVFGWLTLAPPDAVGIAAPRGLGDQLFPGVPLAWALGRLGCLFLGAGLFAAWLGQDEAARVSANHPPSPRPRASVPSPIALAFAAAASVAAGLAWLLRAGLPPTGQLLWLLATLLPAAVLWLSAQRSGAGAGRGGWPDLRFWLPPIAVALAWLLLRATGVPGDLRAARLVDLWQSFGWLQTALAAGDNPLLQSGQPGIANVYLLLIGFPFLYDGGPGDLTRLQIVHCLWLAVSALGVASLCREVLPGRGAAVAVAAYLFSPFLLALCLSPSPFGVFLALGAWSLALLARYWHTQSPTALVAAATALGLATMSAYLWPLIPACGLAVLLRQARRPTSLAVLVLAALAFGVAMLASLPSLSSFGEMGERYVARAGPWVTLENVLLGQEPIAFEGLDELWTRGASDPVAIALGALVSPFAGPRTPIRLWLDALFDPVTTVLATLGIAFCLVGVRRSGSERVLLLLLAVAVVPAALASAYDRTSLLRNLILPVPIALLAAAGLGAVQQATRKRLFAAAIIGIAGTGVFVFDYVTPKRLPDAATAIVLEATAGQEVAGRIWLDFERPAPVEWLYTEPIMSQLSSPPIRVIPWHGIGSLRRASAVVAPDLVFWSPGLETQEEVGRALCERWPEGSVYLLSDEAGLSRAFAVQPKKRADRTEAWRPALPAARVHRIPCRVLPGLLESGGSGT